MEEQVDAGNGGREVGRGVGWGWGEGGRQRERKERLGHDVSVISLAHTQSSISFYSTQATLRLHIHVACLPPSDTMFVLQPSTQKTAV
jgi:hypothetical protein